MAAFRPISSAEECLQGSAVVEIELLVSNKVGVQFERLDFRSDNARGFVFDLLSGQNDCRDRWPERIDIASTVDAWKRGDAARKVGILTWYKRRGKRLGGQQGGEGNEGKEKVHIW